MQTSGTRAIHGGEDVSAAQTLDYGPFGRGPLLLILWA